MKTALPITGYGMMAARHWKEHRPNMVRELEAQAKPEEALYEAQEQTTDKMPAIMERLERNIRRVGRLQIEVTSRSAPASPSRSGGSAG